MHRHTALTVAILAASLTGCEQPKQPEATQQKGPAVMTTFSSEELVQRTVERRAIEAVIWGMPAVNFDRMYQAMVKDAKAGEGSNKIVYWSRPVSWKSWPGRRPGIPA